MQQEYNSSSSTTVNVHVASFHCSGDTRTTYYCCTVPQKKKKNKMVVFFSFFGDSEKGDMMRVSPIYLFIFLYSLCRRICSNIINVMLDAALLTVVLYRKKRRKKKWSFLFFFGDS